MELKLEQGFLSHKEGENPALVSVLCLSNMLYMWKYIGAYNT